MKKTLSVLLPLFFLLLSPGCGSLADLAGVHTVRDKFDPGLDKMTYDEVISDMWSKWGEPTYMKEGGSRNILMLTYNKSSDKLVTKTIYHKGDFFDEASSESEQVREKDYDESYYFIFDQENKLLRWYSYYLVANGYLQDNFKSGDDKYRYILNEKIEYLTGREKIERTNQARGILPAKTQAAPPAAVKVVPLQQATSPLEKKLNELKNLRDKKVITEAEYAKMREKALSDYK